MGDFKGTINRNGRPKGSSNKATAKVREAFTKLVEDNLERLQEDLNSLEPSQRIKIIIELSQFVIPKKKAAAISFDFVEQPLFPFEDLPKAPNDAN